MLKFGAKLAYKSLIATSESLHLKEKRYSLKSELEGGEQGTINVEFSCVMVTVFL